MAKPKREKTKPAKPDGIPLHVTATHGGAIKLPDGREVVSVCSGQWTPRTDDEGEILCWAYPLGRL